jgi:hypothetical protein
VRRQARLRLSRDVGRDADHALKHDQLAPMMHLMFLGGEPHFEALLVAGTISVFV